MLGGPMHGEFKEVAPGTQAISFVEPPDMRRLWEDGPVDPKGNERMMPMLDTKQYRIERVAFFNRVASIATIGTRREIEALAFGTLIDPGYRDLFERR